MNDHQQFTQSAHLYIQASSLILDTLPLQQQMQNCHRELAILIGAGKTSDINRMRDFRMRFWLQNRNRSDAGAGQKAC